MGLGDAGKTDDELLEAVGEHPILLYRPFVVTPSGTSLCRPSEVVLDILENSDIGPFTNEDGEIGISKTGNA